jgi:hypothetical protein
VIGYSFLSVSNLLTSAAICVKGLSWVRRKRKRLDLENHFHYIGVVFEQTIFCCRAAGNSLEVLMCVALVGGMDRLKRDYESVAKKCGVTLKTFTGKESCLVDKMGVPDMAILLTNMISHNARTEVLQRTKALGIPVHFLHSCGVSSLKHCLACIMAERTRDTAA